MGGSGRSSINSSFLDEIGRGHLHYELEEKERSRGERRVGPFGHRSMAGVHGRGGRRWRSWGERHRARREEGEEGHLGQELTRSTMTQTARPEEAGVDGEELGGAAARAEETGTVAAIAGLPARAG